MDNELGLLPPLKYLTRFGLLLISE